MVFVHFEGSEVSKKVREMISMTDQCMPSLFLSVAPGYVENTVSKNTNLTTTKATTIQFERKENVNCSSRWNLQNCIFGFLCGLRKTSNKQKKREDMPGPGQGP